MTPTQLYQFLIIVEAGSLGRAARQLNISGPALSKRLKSLEWNLGVQLMERTSKGMTPTAIGACLADHARVIRGQFNRARDDISGMKEGKAGRLAVGFTPSFGSSVVTPAMVLFLKERPNVQIATRQVFASKLMSLLSHNEIDLAVMMLDQRLPEDEYSQIHLGENTCYVMARAAHPLANRKKVSMLDVMMFPWLMGYPGDRLRAWLEAKFASSKHNFPIPQVEFDSLSFARRMLKETDLLAFLPAASVRSDLASRELVRIAIPELSWARPVGIVHRKATPSLLATAMIEKLKSSMEID